MQDDGLKRVVLFLVVVAYAALYASLLKATLDSEGPFEPNGPQVTVLPILSGALGLVLALSLGVEPAKSNSTGLTDRLKVLLKASNLLRFGAIVYLLSAIAGGYVWWKKDDLTPDLVIAVVLSVVGYAVAAVTAAARPTTSVGGG